MLNNLIVEFHIWFHLIPGVFRNGFEMAFIAIDTA